MSGWATFSGAIVASADDPGDDGVGPAGAEIVGASVTHRPEQEDVLLRLRLASMPEGGAPGVLYRWAFTAEQTAYEVRALRAAVTADPPTAERYFALYACAPSCTESTRLSGGIGATGVECGCRCPSRPWAPRRAPSSPISRLRPRSGRPPGPLVVLDARVELGIAPPSAPQADVFSAQAELVEGRFSATLDASSLPPGAHRVWARACLGETCGGEWVEVAR